jgi:ABC-type multidrug transport system permease subunit
MTSSPVAQLILARLREFVREPEVIFWVFGFPLVMTVLLGMAFRERPVDKVTVDVRNGPFAEMAKSTLVSAGTFKVASCADADCRTRLRIGKTDLVIVSAEGTTPQFDYLYDPTRRESITARKEVDDALQRAQGRKDIFLPRDQEFKEPGGRYIDFLVPGLLGMGIMGGGMWGVGFATVDMRIRKLLKRFLATPMKKSHFLWALIVSRLCIQIPEVVILIAFAEIAFGVKVYGTFTALALLVLLGSLAFSGLGLLVGSRAKTIEAVSGMMNLTMMPMWILSGIFFSPSRYPDIAQPFIRLLPLTALIDALRAVMIDGATLLSQTTPIAILSSYIVITFLVALRIFRWQ